MWLGILTGFSIGVVVSSFLEHAIHKYFLHSTPKALSRNDYVKSMWKGHAISHHGHYAPDDHYTRDETNKDEVLVFSWYEGPLIVITATAVFYFLDIAVRLLAGMNIHFFLPEMIGMGIAFAIYYAAYEGLHAIMHVPKKWKWLHDMAFMRWLNRHHYQHHVDPRTNFNVILPIADYFWGTKKRLPKEQYSYADSPNHNA